MADLTIAGTVNNADGSTPTNVKLGEAMTQGTPYYIDTTGASPVAKKGICTAADGATKGVIQGVTINGGLLNQFVPVIQAGRIDLGTTVIVMGKQYVLSHNSGKIMPIEDLASTDFVTYLFFTDTVKPQMNIRAWGVQVP